jgi:hypothetical protein
MRPVEASSIAGDKLSPLNGYSGTVSLSCSGLPAGASCYFNPQPGQPAFTSNFYIATAPTTPTGNYTITVTATSKGLTHTTQIPITVCAPSPVGGLIVPVDKLVLIQPYLEIAIAAILMTTAIAVLYRNYVKKRPEISIIS